MILLPSLAQIEDTIAATAPHMPPVYWWVTGGVLLLLGVAALIDAFTEIVPDILILIGLFAVILVQGFCLSWKMAGISLASAVATGAIIWIVNELWYRQFKHDALGMGDAKWTMLSVACFGIEPSLIAWGAGAILASLCILAVRWRGYELTQITFGPFLMLGLCAALYGLRFSPG